MFFFLGADSRRQVSNLEEDDDMLQYAIQQSLLQSGHDDDQVRMFYIISVGKLIVFFCFLVIL